MRNRHSVFLFFLVVFFLQQARAQDATDESAVATTEPQAAGKDVTDKQAEGSTVPPMVSAPASDTETGNDETVEETEPAALPVFDLTNEDTEDTAEEEPETKSDMPANGPKESPAENQADNGIQTPPVQPLTAPSERARPVKKKFMFGMGIAPGGEHGFGGAVRFRLEHVSFDFAYGVLPMVVTSIHKETKESNIDFALATVHADGGVAFFFGDRVKGFQDGIRTQGIFDNVMGPGFGLGWTRERQCSRFRNKCYKNFVLGVGSGVKVFPKYQDRVADFLDLDADTEASPFFVVQMYLGVTLMWYL